MKRIIALVLLALVACGPEPTQSQQADLDYGWDSSVNVFTDPLTGCEYLTRYTNGITPRLGANGLPRCRNSLRK
jgi:hypothetical protein